MKRARWVPIMLVVPILAGCGSIFGAIGPLTPMHGQPPVAMSTTVRLKAIPFTGKGNRTFCRVARLYGGRVPPACRRAKRHR
jgi:hypothetical protein